MRQALLSLLVVAAAGCTDYPPPALPPCALAGECLDGGRALDAASGAPTPDTFAAPMADVGAPSDMAPPESDMAPPGPDMAPPGPDMAPPGPDMAPPGPDMAPPGPDMAPPGPDMAPPEPDMAPPGPDMAPPEPDMAPPEPDMAPPEPDMAPPEPDMVPPEPDMAPPEPDMAPPEPDMAPPEPDMAPPEPEPDPGNADSVTPYDWSNLQGDKFRYAGSTIEEGNTRWMFYCGNRDSRVVRDHVLLRKADRLDGQWRWSDDESVAVWPGTPGTWDHEHVCDPDVVAGEFWYRQPGQPGQELYNYALFYTGANAIEGQGGYNQVGWAVAQSLDGPWFKVVGNGDGPLNDALVLADNPGEWWGVGQPSATAIDGGRVMLFYTRGDRNGTRTIRRVFDLADANDPVAESPELTLTTRGLTRIDGAPDPINNGGAFMYDGETDRFWLTRSGHPLPPAGSCPDFVSTHIQLASIPASYMWDGITDTDGDGVDDVTWTVHRDARTPGFDLNFDPGFIRNAWGGILQPGEVPMLVSTGIFDCADWLWSYRIHEYTYR